MIDNISTFLANTFMSKSNISSQRIEDVNILTGRRVLNLNSERLLAIT